MDNNNVVYTKLIAAKEACQGGERVLAQDKYNRDSRRWCKVFRVVHYLNVLSSLIEGTLKTAYEYIPPDILCRFYLDLEFWRQFNKDKWERVGEMVQLVQKEVEEALGLPGPGEWVVLCATDDKKVSYHLILQGFYWENNHEHLKNWLQTNKVGPWSTNPLLQVKTKGGKTICFADAAVYSKNQQMRMALAPEKGGEKNRPFRFAQGGSQVTLELMKKSLVVPIDPIPSEARVITCPGGRGEKRKGTDADADADVQDLADAKPLLQRYVKECVNPDLEDKDFCVSVLPLNSTQRTAFPSIRGWCPCGGSDSSDCRLVFGSDGKVELSCGGDLPPCSDELVNALFPKAGSTSERCAKALAKCVSAAEEGEGRQLEPVQATLKPLDANPHPILGPLDYLLLPTKELWCPVCKRKHSSPGKWYVKVGCDGWVNIQCHSGSASGENGVRLHSPELASTLWTKSAILRKFHETYALVLHKGAMKATWVAPQSSENDPPKRLYIPPEALGPLFSHRPVAVPSDSTDGGWAWLNVAKLWLSDRHRRQYADGTVFHPIGLREAGADVEVAGGQYLNTWSGFSFAGELDTPGRDPPQVFLDHVLKVICGGKEEVAEWVVMWFAAMIQFPRERFGTALVLKGVSGTGKSLLLTVVGKLMGTHFKHLLDEKHLVGNFNAHFADALFVVLDEVSIKGNKKGLDKVKGMVTEATHMVEAKGVDADPQPNHVHLAVSSNRPVPLSIEPFDRRYCCPDVVAEKPPPEYFEPLLKMKKGEDVEGLNGLLWYLGTQVEVDRERLTMPPYTATLLKIKLESSPVSIRFWHSVLRKGTNDWDKREGREVWEESLADSHILTQLGNFATQNRNKGYSIEIILSEWEGIVPYEQRNSCVKVGTLEECRAAFCKAYLCPSTIWD